MKNYFILFLLYAFSCNNANNQCQQHLEVLGDSIGSRIAVPSGYQRVDVETNSFAYYLRNLPLKPEGSKVKLYNGKYKSRQDVHFAIVDMSVGDKDLQQCADAIMRLRAEFLFKQKRYHDIHFNFTSGHTVRFIDWAKGIRPVVSGNSVSFRQKASKDFSYQNLMNYLQTIYMYSGSYSLSKELNLVSDIKQLKAGDVFITGGFPGHAIIVLDVAINEKTDDKIFLLGQSYMPAQEIHVLVNFNDSELSPWYSIDFGEMLLTPEWDFPKMTLKRFPEH